MGWTLTIGRAWGTEIKVHLTFFVLVAFWAMAGYQQGGLPGAIAACLLLFALFACVLLHEFGHILMARRFGVRTPDVILLPIGGVARLERIPDVPRQELLIAIAGPAVTLAIVVALYALLSLDGSPAAAGRARARRAVPGDPPPGERLAADLQSLSRLSHGRRAGAAGPALQPPGPGERNQYRRPLRAGAARSWRDSTGSAPGSPCSPWWPCSCSSAPAPRRARWRPGSRARVSTSPR